MKKPLFRWIIGDSNSNGLCVFSHAIKNIIRLYKNNFDFLICSNAINLNCKDEIKKIAQKFNIEIYEQSWFDFPLNKNTILETPIGRQGSFWKICPPRLRIDSHEIICDNDIIIINPINAIFEFLQKDKILMMKEDAFCVGKYFPIFKENENYNSGLYGLPPHYNFNEDLKTTWEKNSRHHNLIWRDEQGLVTGTLKKHEHITITSNEIIHLFPEGRCSSYEFKIIDENQTKTRIMRNIQFNEFSLSISDKGYHFLGVNREKHHRKWHEYKNQNQYFL